MQGQLGVVLPPGLALCFERDDRGVVRCHVMWPNHRRPQWHGVGGPASINYPKRAQFGAALVAKCCPSQVVPDAFGA